MQVVIEEGDLYQSQVPGQQVNDFFSLLSPSLPIVEYLGLICFPFIFLHGMFSYGENTEEMTKVEAWTLPQMQGHLQLQLLQVSQAKVMHNYYGAFVYFLAVFCWQNKERGDAAGNNVYELLIKGRR